jgi:2-acylglycerol O-acyltransferase 2
MASDRRQHQTFILLPRVLLPGAGYLPLLPSFRNQVPVRPTPLTASVCVVVPLLRDICLWLGARVVSRRTFEHTLRERRAVLICPGGQAEMCLTNRLHRNKEYTVYAGHRGEAGGVLPCAGLGYRRGTAQAGILRSRGCWPA